MADIGKRIKARREAINMTQEELAKKLGYKNKSTIAKIEIGINDIAQSKVVDFAKALDTSIAYLMGWDEEEPGYYLNDETAKVAQEIFDNKELRILFDATRNASPEDLKTLQTMALALKRKESGNTDESGC